MELGLSVDETEKFSLNWLQTRGNLGTQVPEQSGGGLASGTFGSRDSVTGMETYGLLLLAVSLLYVFLLELYVLARGGFQEL